MISKTKIKKEKREKRRQRSRAKIFGTVDQPRICLFRSARHIYAQLIVDGPPNKVIVAASDSEVGKSKEGKVGLARETGRLLAEKAKKAKVTKVVFDKSGYRYHGRVKALAEGARQAGLNF